MSENKFWVTVEKFVFLELQWTARISLDAWLAPGAVPRLKNSGASPVLWETHAEMHGAGMHGTGTHGAGMPALW